MSTNYDLGETFEKDGYHFTIVKPLHDGYIYWVRCRETGEIKGTSISFEVAADLIIDPIKHNINVININSKNPEYVHNAFWNALRGKKMRECNEVVNSEIQRMISGRIEPVSFGQSDCLAYQTDHFVVKVLFENGKWRPVTNVEVITKRTDINAV